MSDQMEIIAGQKSHGNFGPHGTHALGNVVSGLFSPMLAKQSKSLGGHAVHGAFFRMSQSESLHLSLREPEEGW